jgi:hypothetical protein
VVSPKPTRPAQPCLSHTALDLETQRAVPIGEMPTLSTDLVVTSLVFHGEPTVNFYDPGLRHLRSVGADHHIDWSDPSKRLRLWLSLDARKWNIGSNDDGCLGCRRIG